jgi:archaellum component FlaG (FlaF/FlaG flagellin family)
VLKKGSDDLGSVIAFNSPTHTNAMNIYQHSITRLTTLALLGFFLTARATPPPSININLGVDETDYPGSTINPGESGGVVPETSWNNIDGAALSASSLIGSDGNPTTASLTITPCAHYFIPVSGSAQPGDAHLMHGVIYNSGPITITVSDLGAPYSGVDYDLYVYCQGDTVGGAHPQLMSVYNTNKTALLAGPVSAWGAPVKPLYPFIGTYVLSDGSGGQGNYYKFSHLNANGFALQLNPSVSYVECEGMQIEPSPSVPYILSTSPSGSLVSQTAPVQIQIKDYVTQVDTSSIQLIFNGSPVTPTISKPAGTNVTTVSYIPPGGLDSNTTYTVEIQFNDNATPSPNAQDFQYSFTTLNNAYAQTVINIDINGRANSGGNAQQIGATFAGQGYPAGGTTFNGILADSALPNGIDNNTNLTFGANNLLDSVGSNTTVNFTMSNVAANNDGTANTAPSGVNALFGDYVTATAPTNASFTISGLGSAPSINLYLYQSHLPGGLFIGGQKLTPTIITNLGNYTPGNTLHFTGIPVSGGTVSGVFGNDSGQASLSGLTIEKPVPGPYVKSVAPTGGSVPPDAVIKVELWDYVSQVDTNTIQLLLDGSAVAATISKPAGTNVTTITYAPPGGLTASTSYTVDIQFSDNSAPAIQSTAEYSFTVAAANYPTQPIISVNFVSGATPGTTTLAASDIAGVLPVANWNNRADGVPSISGLIDWNGNPTTSSLNVATPNATYTAGNSAPPSGDKIMLSGFLYNPGPLNVSVSGLGSAYTGSGYNLYVYYRGDATAAAGPEFLTVLDGASNTIAGPVLVSEDFAGGLDLTYTMSDGNGSAGNYYVFSNLTASSFILRATTTNVYTYMDGLQIESTPEPEIGINFGVDELNFPGTTINSGEKAGVVSVPNWNNIAATATSATNIIDTFSNATTVNVTVDSPIANYVLPNTATNLGDKHLMYGWLYYPGSLKMTVSGISSDYTNGGYDLYVYSLGDGTGGAHPEVLTVSNATGDVAAGPATIWASSTQLPFNGQYVQSDGNGSVGNYYKFSNLHLDTFKLNLSPNASNGVYTVLQGLEIVHHHADVTPPTLVSAVRSLTPNTKVIVTFSEPVSQITATNPGNYVINNGVTVTSATLLSTSIGIPQTVVLTTSPINNGNPNTLTVNGVQDLSGNVANSQIIISVPSDNFRVQDSSTNHLLVLEAEDYSMNTPGAGNQSWTFTTSSPYLLSTSASTNFSGTGGMIVLPNAGNAYSYNPGDRPVNNPELDYLVNFTTTGTFTVWIRGSGDSDAAGQNDSINLGLDGAIAYRMNGLWTQAAGFAWGSSPTPGGATFTVSTPGVHTLNIWMREDGFVFDKLVLSSNPNYNPTGTGPAESSLSASPVAVMLSGGNLNFTWSGGGTLQSSTNVSGPYSDITGSSSPWTVTPDGTHKFYRVRK